MLVFINSRTGRSQFDRSTGSYSNKVAGNNGGGLRNKFGSRLASVPRRLGPRDERLLAVAACGCLGVVKLDQELNEAWRRFWLS